MKSTTSVVARQCRLRDWAEQVKECKSHPAGLTVKDWCAQHQITVANYYYRLRQLRKACLESIPPEPEPQSIIPVPAGLINRRFVCTTLPGNTYEGTFHSCYGNYIARIIEDDASGGRRC